MIVSLYRYGWLNNFRPVPELPNQVYRFDPDTGAVRTVADQYVRNNGIAFSGDGSAAFVYVFLRFILHSISK